MSRFETKTIALLAFAAIATGISGGAYAQPDTGLAAQSLGRSHDWDAYKLTRNGETTCYAVSNPIEKTPKTAKRDKVFFMISNWPGRKIAGEPSVISGYTYQEGSTATVTIGASKFELFTKDDSAWFSDAAAEKKLLGVVKTGQTMVVKGTSARGTLTSDKYSLKGVSAALDKINEACK